MSRERASRHGAMGVTLILGVLLASAGTALASDWTRWRGPRGDGVSNESGWQADALQRSSSIAWTVNVGKGHSTVVVQGDRVYTAGNREISSGSSSVLEEVVYCLDAETGREIWRYSYPTETQDFPGPGATPLVDGDRLYMVSRNGTVYCFAADSGKVMWRRKLVEEQLAETPQWGFCSSPIVEDNLLLLNAGSAGLAFDKRTGKVVWSSEAGRGGLTTPVLLDVNGKRIAAIVAGGNVNGVEAATGQVLWTYEWHSDADPIALGTRLYLKGSLRGQGQAMLELASGKPELLWESRDMATLHTSSVIRDGFAYGFGRVRGKALLTCVDLGSGEITWREDVGDYSALMASGDKLIILDVDGDLIVAEASPEAYKVVSTRKVIDMRYERPSGAELNACWSAPVLAHGRIYARSSFGDLSCVTMTL